MESLYPIVRLIVWALEKPSFLKIFALPFFFFNLSPPFSSHFQPASGGQNRKGCRKTSLACFLSRDSSSWQKKLVSLTGKRSELETLCCNEAVSQFGAPVLLAPAGEGQGWKQQREARAALRGEGVFHVTQRKADGRKGFSVMVITA